MDAAWIAASFAISAAGTAAAIGYARARSMIDLPGQRRSHSVPTPRGGGIGIVVASMFALWFGVDAQHKESASMLLVCVALVAGVGWWDDHRPLRASVRFAVHCLAGLLLAAPLILAAIFPDDSRHADPAQSRWLLALAAATVVGAAWSINLHNFIDGINGLLALHCAWLFAAVGVLDATLTAQLGWKPFALAAACLAFVPFN
ncbi:MAG TPA: glycosyl transferase family 4, partial [Tahibacter sp.]|nr:glycosyl transferase family 4 [Tahibacter sp.]